MRTHLLASMAFALASPAYAGCELSLNPCSTDSFGNTYTYEQNLSGSYSTYRNGNPYSTTTQTLSGTYREDYRDGGSRSFNMAPTFDPRSR